MCYCISNHHIIDHTEKMDFAFLFTQQILLVFILRKLIQFFVNKNFYMDFPYSSTLNQIIKIIESNKGFHIENSYCEEKEKSVSIKTQEILSFKMPE